MYTKNGELPTPIVAPNSLQGLDSLDALTGAGDVNEKPYKVFIGHNLGHRVFTMSVPFRQFKEISDVANDREVGPVAQRKLDETHAKKLAGYMLKGLISAAMLRRQAADKEVPETFQQLMRLLGEQPYFSLQPLVCNIRGVSEGGADIRGVRMEWQGETAGFKVFLAERHILWVIDGQHRRHAADLCIEFLEGVRQTGRYPSKGAVLYPNKGQAVSEQEMVVWNETYEAARSYATLTVEVHLGLNIDQERQLFHDLNRLGKKVDASLAFQFDGSNPITHFIKNKLVSDLGISITEVEPKDWSDDTGALLLKDVVAINAIAFLNKGNISGATPAVVEPREPTIQELWQRIAEIPNFGESRAKEKTVASQPVVLKALAKITYDLKFSNRRPEDAEELFSEFLSKVADVDFSHTNPMWNFYNLTEGQKVDANLKGLDAYLPEDQDGVNRDIGSIQGSYMRFGAKHNDIYPILADMIRWSTGLPSRREAN
ncbi:DNA sulfur modification protein DndB [Novosphingobium sp. APW14]|uniref:DNA sulfur modification protein DndB n=1 Tax=Novosphingobium sp. APW14 TaxID=3077237 RepID=UPI0028E0121A|nr:DNA sulfur modification protein DndB [Novosphingobium sp. APW14]MDT9013053.1 DNA sulfur modification protein DndB [Novosphingobium sp. APW14]